MHATIVPSALSPAAEIVHPGQEWRSAEAYVAAHPGTDMVIGRGRSMLPLYREGTVLVLESRDLGALELGMTVVFVGDSGLPVAHALVGRARDGWIAMGLANPEPDRTRVQSSNYLGAVVKAFVSDPTVAGSGLAALDPTDSNREQSLAWLATPLANKPPGTSSAE